MSQRNHRIKGYWRGVLTRQALRHGSIRCRLACGHSVVMRIGVPLNEASRDLYDLDVPQLFCTQCWKGPQPEVTADNIDLDSFDNLQ